MGPNEKYGQIVLKDSILIFASQSCKVLKLRDHIRYYPIDPQQGSLTFAYASGEVEFAVLSGANGWISPLRLRKHCADRFGYMAYQPCEAQVRWTLPSAHPSAEFFVSLRATVQVVNSQAFLEWYAYECTEGEALTASRVMSGHLPMKAANLTRLYSVDRAAVVEQMLSVVMADMNELTAVGVRVLESSWVVETPAITGSQKRKERPSVWKG